MNDTNGGEARRCGCPQTTSAASSEGLCATLPMAANTDRMNFEMLAKIVKALAHPSRLTIVLELSRHEERCVCELTELIGADMSTVSKHLTVLKNAGVVGSQKRGNQVCCRLLTPCIVHCLQCLGRSVVDGAEATRLAP
jgi:DNA-binding transcriptional ArsR family regulator